MVKNYPTLEGFFIPEALCPLAIDPFIVALAASYIAPRNVGCAKQTWEDTALRMYGIDPTEFADYMWAALRTNKDAWHAMKGYRSDRDMNLIVHSKTHGEVLRARCDVVMIQ